MDSIGEDHHEDVVRAFFRRHVGDIGVLLSRVADVTAKLAQSSGRDLHELLPEANRVISVSWMIIYPKGKVTLIQQTVLSSAVEYRQYNLGVYGILLPMIDPWTSNPELIDVILSLFETTTKMLDSSTRVVAQNTHMN